MVIWCGPGDFTGPVPVLGAAVSACFPAAPGFDEVAGFGRWVLLLSFIWEAI